MAIVVNNKKIGNIRYTYNDFAKATNQIALYCLLVDGVYKGGKLLNLFDYVKVSNNSIIPNISTSSENFSITQSEDDEELFILKYEGESLNNGIITISYNNKTVDIEVITNKAEQGGI